MRSTALAAFDSIKPQLTELQQRVLAALKAAPYGLAFHELEPLITDMSDSSIRTRVSELVKAGAVVCSGEIRRTKSNRSALVWCSR